MPPRERARECDEAGGPVHDASFRRRLGAVLHLMVLSWCALCSAAMGLQAGDAPSGAIQANLISANGTAARGIPHIVHGQLSIGAASIPVEQVVALTFERLAANHLDQGVVLQDGEIIGGVVLSLQADKLTLASDHFGTLVLPIGKIQVLALTACPLSAFGMSALGQSSAPGATLSNGDLVAGAVSFVNDLAIGISTGRRIIEVARSRVGQVRLPAPAAGPAAQPAPAKAPNAIQHLRLVTGERIDGRIDALDDQVCAIDTTWGQTIKVPSGLISSLWSDGGPLTPLSTVRPATVKQIGQFDESTPLRLDRNQRGGFLTVFGQRAERGIGCQARCELSYQLDGSCTALVGAVGIDDGAGAGGAAAFQVFVDGKVAFNVASRGGQPAKLMLVPLSGAKLLQLVVEFGPGASLTGAADWCWPVLVHGVSPGG